MRVVHDAEHARRLVAYRAAANDVEAAAALGLKVDTFRLWRKRHDLPAKTDRKPRGPNSQKRPKVKIATGAVKEALNEIEGAKLERIRRLLPR